MAPCPIRTRNRANHAHVEIEIGPRPLQGAPCRGRQFFSPSLMSYDNLLEAVSLQPPSGHSLSVVDADRHWTGCDSTGWLLLGVDYCCCCRCTVLYRTANHTRLDANRETARPRDRETTSICILPSLRPRHAHMPHPFQQGRQVLCSAGAHRAVR
jgi:hypothetical protein